MPDREKMKVDWQVLPTDYSPPPNANHLVARLKEVTPELLERLQKRFGGVLPEQIEITLIVGCPVEVRFRVKHDKLQREEGWGTVIRECSKAWVILGVNRHLWRTALHEYLHLLGFTNEKFVRQAVKDFVNLERFR